MNDIKEESSSSENESNKKSTSTPSDVGQATHLNPYLQSGNPLQSKAILDKEKQKRKLSQQVSLETKTLNQLELPKKDNEASRR